MRKLSIYSPGGYDKLILESGESTPLEEAQVKVEVSYSGVNYADVCIRWGIYESAKKFVGWPITPGFEFSGVVKESRSSKFEVGQRVFGVTLFNAYADEVNVPEHQLFHLPENISLEEGATIPAVYMTAYHGLFQHIILRPKSKILIHSAAGGVGSALVSLAKRAGFFVVGVVGSSHKREHVLEFGADYVIDKSNEDLWKKAKEYCPEGYDAIYDANGVETIKESFNHVKPTGKLVVYGFTTMLPKGKGKLNWIKLALNYLKTPRFNPLDLTNTNKSIIAFNLSFLFERMDLFSEAMDDICEGIENGELKALPVKTFSHKEAWKSHEYIESARSIGKIAIDWLN